MDRRVVVDTDVLIAFYNQEDFAESFFELNRSADVYFSTVTINEFIRGAHDPQSKNLVEGFLAIVRENLLTPAEGHWIECGTISEQLLQGKKRSKQDVLLLQNDILIALGARDHEATLVTCNKKDFSILQKIIPIQIEFWQQDH